MFSLLGTRIVSIEDDLSITRCLGMIIENSGGIFKYGTSLKDALYLATEFCPHVILLDLKLDDEDGLDILANEEFKKACKLTKVIILSSTKDLATISKVKQLGAVDFLLKPLNQKELLKKLKHHLEDWNSPVVISKDNDTNVSIPGKVYAIGENRALIDMPYKIKDQKRLVFDDASFELILRKNLRYKAQTSAAQYLGLGQYRNELDISGAKFSDITEILKLRVNTIAIK